MQITSDLDIYMDLAAHYSRALRRILEMVERSDPHPDIDIAVGAIAKEALEYHPLKEETNG